MANNDLAGLAAAMMGEEAFDDLVRRYADYRDHRDTTDLFIRDVMIYANRVDTVLHNEIPMLQSQLRRAHRDLEASLHVSADMNSYIMVVVDGNELLFDDFLIQRGFAGGKIAAENLHNSLQTYFTVEGAPPPQIYANVIGNLPGLSKTLKNAGVIEHQVRLYEFVSGFNQVHPTFDFVDVNTSWQAVHAKIDGTAKFHLRNFNCKRLVLGLANEPTEVPFLRELMHIDNRRRRLVLLHGPPVHRRIVDLDLPTVTFPQLLRRTAIGPAGPAGPAAITSQDDHDADMKEEEEESTMAYENVLPRPASPPPQITLPLALGNRTNNNNRGRRGNKPKPSTTSRSTSTPNWDWNPGPRGLDPKIPINPKVLERMKKRTDKEKLCCNHFLRGPCNKLDCEFVHNYKPNHDERNVIRLLARMNPCGKGQGCGNKECIYGHHCPSVVNGVCTNGKWCKFSLEAHPPGTRCRAAKNQE